MSEGPIKECPPAEPNDLPPLVICPTGGSQRSFHSTPGTHAPHPVRMPHTRYACPTPGTHVSMPHTWYACPLHVLMATPLTGSHTMSVVSLEPEGGVGCGSRDWVRAHINPKLCGSSEPQRSQRTPHTMLTPANPQTRDECPPKPTGLRQAPPVAPCHYGPKAPTNHAPSA